MNKGRLIVISGPSGSGKDTIIAECLKQLGDKAFLSVSMTTRPMRPGDEEGVSYYFVSTDQFRQNIKNDKMLEYACYGSNFYGTPLEPIQRKIAEGKLVFLNIEVEGAMNVRRLVPEVCEIFILPPSMEVLEKRLRNRGTETEDSIKKRMKIAKEEISFADEYDYRVVNDDLQVAVDEIMKIIEKYNEE